MSNLNPEIDGTRCRKVKPERIRLDRYDEQILTVYTSFHKILVFSHVPKSPTEYIFS